MNKAHIKRFNNNLPLPEYKTSGAAGFDLSARERTVIAPGAVALVPLNVAIAPPPGYFVLLAARSSLHKRGLMPGNGVGIIDADYAGNDDEYKVVLYNFSDIETVIEAGERIAQGVFVPLVQVGWEEVDDMGTPSRGGFGTTGK
jgi:dUTP pyrophosphatase